MKVLVHDGIGVWLAARRLNAGRFVWPRRVGAHGRSRASSLTRWCSACRGSGSVRPGSSRCCKLAHVRMRDGARFGTTFTIVQPMARRATIKNSTVNQSLATMPV
jgi:hypothetical protein